MCVLGTLVRKKLMVFMQMWVLYSTSFSPIELLVLWYWHISYSNRNELHFYKIMTFSWNPVMWSFFILMPALHRRSIKWHMSVETRPSQLLVCLDLYSHALFISAAWISGRPKLPTPKHQYLTSWEWDSVSYKLLPSAVFVFVWNAGSPSYFSSAWLLNSRPLQGGSRRNSESEAMDAAPHSLVFQPPELPEDTLMEV